MKSSIKNIKALGFQWETADPFLFCVHHEDAYPKGNDEFGPATGIEGRNIGQDFTLKDGWRMYHGSKVPGFPGHPHRGFETITVVRKGMVDHSDSLGAAGRYGDGDVQWMTAGKGLIHAEMFPLLKQDQENPMELFQIWLNLPAKSKMVDPNFKMLWAEDIPIQNFKDKNGRSTQVEIIAGKLENSAAPRPPKDSWAADVENDVAIWLIQMEANTEWVLPKAGSNLNRSLYFFGGSNLSIDENPIPSYHGAEVDSDNDLVLKTQSEPCKILMLQGKPINEPIAQHGPFVMNSNQEIEEAFADYQRTQFGGWPWPQTEQVHDIKSGRFAKYFDGEIETKS